MRSRELWSSGSSRRYTRESSPSRPCAFTGRAGGEFGKDRSLTPRTGLQSADRERVREANAIEAVVEEYLPLQPDGRGFKALCPFHSEKTPSFKVDPERGTYHCFGCHERGDVFSFVMKMETVEFPEALRLLAERGGVPLQPSGPGRGPRREDRAEARQLLEKSGRWFQSQLAGSEGVTARRYLAERGFESETLRRFGVGYAPPGWSNLTDFLRQSQVSLPFARQVGLVKEGRNGSFYDVFRGRVMFPIRSAQGGVVGFGGRILESTSSAEERSEAKYVNSSDSPHFRKGELLYGLHEGKDAIRRDRLLLLMEGYTDVMMAHQAGFPHAVAALGTELTEANADRLNRHADDVVLVFDGDEPGRKAAKKALQRLLATPLAVRVVLLEGGLDPCDLLREDAGRRRFESILAEAVPALEWVLKELRGEFGKGTADSRDRVAREFFPFLHRIPSEIRKGAGLQLLAHALGIPGQTVGAEYRRWQKGQRVRLDRGRGTPAGELLPGIEDALVLAMLETPTRAKEFVSLYPLESFQDGVLRSLTNRLLRAEERFSVTDLEDPEEKSRYLNLIDRLESRAHESEQGTQLFRDLLCRVLETRAQRLRVEARDSSPADVRDARIGAWTTLRGAISRLRSGELEDWETLSTLAREHLPGEGN